MSVRGRRDTTIRMRELWALAENAQATHQKNELKARRN
jgi:hypothetical protein